MIDSVNVDEGSRENLHGFLDIIPPHRQPTILGSTQQLRHLELLKLQLLIRILYSRYRYI